MAVQTIYPLASTAVTPNWWGNTQLNGAAPAQANTAFGPNVGVGQLNTPYWKMFLGATTGSGLSSINSFLATAGPNRGTGSGASNSGDAFIVGPFNGTFAAGTWVFNWNMRVTVAATGTGYIQMRCWRSVNANGTSATEIITAGAASGVNIALQTTDSNSQIVLSPAAITLNNEYLFIQLQWIISGVGTNSSNRVVFRVGTTTITTPDFQLTPVTSTLNRTQDAQAITGAGVITIPFQAQIVAVV